MQLQHQLSVLQRLEIESCHQLVSLFFEESELQLENEAVQSFMLRLESLTITDCTKLEKLPHGLHMLECLVELKLSGCPNLVSLPEKGFPSMLRTLHINDCKALESPLPCWNNVDNSLESLYVNKCASLTGLISSPSCCSSSSTNIWVGGLPSSLKSLTIFTCRKLEVLFSGDEEIKIHCPLLENIQIADCSKLNQLPDIRSNDSLGKLKELILYQCENLGDLSDGWLRAITNLTEIRIGILRNGEQTRVFSYILKEAVFLKNLTSLRLDSLTTDVHPSEWGLNRISSLRKLSMINSIRVRRVGEEVLKVYVFPLDGMLLPTSLTNLVLDGFPDLERLSSKGFESLSSLEDISVYYCPRLAYIPEGGLPNTLMQLTVMGCPLLKKQCEKGKGKYWPSIAGIPRSSIT